MADASLFMLPQARARQFLAWWAGELSDLIATAAPASRAWKVMFLRSGSGCEVYVRARDGIELVGTSQSGNQQPIEELRHRLGKGKISPAQVVLRLQPSEVVQTSLKVPAAARGVLEPILRNQIERLAPWPAEKTLFAYEIVPASSESGTLEVALTVTARSLIEGLVAELDGLGYAPGVVDCGTDVSVEPRLNLLAGQTGEIGRSGHLLVSLIGLVLLASLIAGAVGIVGFVQKTRELSALSSKVEESRSKLSLELPSQSDVRRQRRQAWLAAEKVAQPSMAIMLEALSRALPDDAWLNRLEVEQGTARLAGNATNAAALIGPIEASGHFSDVQFSAPTTRAEGESEESFTITAKIVPGRNLN